MGDLKSILSDFVSRGFKFAVNGDKLQIKGDLDALSDSDKEFIKSHKQALIEFIAERDAVRKKHQVVIPQANRDGELPLSVAQRRLWFAEQMAIDNEGQNRTSRYNVPVALELTGKLNIVCVEYALNTIIQRHEILRTVYRKNSRGEPVQAVLSGKNIEFRTVGKGLNKTELERILAEEAARPFELAVDLMLRALLVSVGADVHILLVTMHHIASDGWSLGVLTQEFSHLYNAKLTGSEFRLPKLSIQYGDFSAWQHQQIASQEFPIDKEFWQKYLADMPQLHNLPLDYNRNSIQGAIGAVHQSRISPETLRKLRNLCVSEGVSLFILLQTVFALLLAKFSRSNDIVVGTVVANREHPQLGDLIGFFVNTVLIRTRIDWGESFFDLLRKNAAGINQVFDHSTDSFDLLVDRFHSALNSSHNPLFQVLFTVDEGIDFTLRLDDLAVQPLELPQDTAKFELSVAVSIKDDALSVQWEFNKSLFNEDSIYCLSSAFTHYVAHLVESPALPISAATISKNSSKVCLDKADSQIVSCLHDQYGTDLDFYTQVAYLLDESRLPVLEGASGSLWLPESIVAKHTNLKVGAEEINPNDERVCLVDTGILARLMPGGALSYKGLTSEHAIVDGYPVNFADITPFVLAHPLVENAFIRTGTPTNTLSAAEKLILYVLPKEPTSVDLLAQAVFSSLRASLPSYLMPSGLSVLESLEAFRACRSGAVSAPEPFWYEIVAYLPPERPEEVALAAIWCDLLQLNRASLNDNFFALGGNSLTLVRLEFAILEGFSVAVSIGELFSHPTLSEQARLIHEKEQLAALPQIARLPQNVPAPLSYAQQRLWFLDKMEGQSAQYNMPLALRITGKLDSAALQFALQQVIERHEVLRASYHSNSQGDPILQLSDSIAFTLRLEDVSLRESGEREAAVKAYIDADARRPFDLSRDLMLRGALIKLGEDDHVLSLAVHHIAADGWSVGLILDEFVALYQDAVEGRSPSLAPLKIQYSDFAHWQRELLADEKYLAPQLDYWKSRLHGAPPVHGLPLDKPRPEVTTFNGAVHHQQLERQLKEQLNALCLASDSTLFMVLDAAFAVLLSRFSRESDIVIGTPIANRSHSDISELIGFFVNTLVLRHTIDLGQSFRDFLADVRTLALEAYEHQHVPFEMLVESLDVTRSSRHSPVFQIMFVLQNAESGDLTLPGLSITPLEQAHTVAKFDLTLSIKETAQGLSVAWEYNTDLFGPDTIAQLANSLEHVIRSVLENPDADLDKIVLLSESEIAPIIARSSSEYSCADRFKGQCIHEIFAKQVAANPEGTAVVFGEQRLTYRELNERASKLALFLQAHYEMYPDQLIGICLPKSVDMIVAILAVLKAGSAYVPLDPDYPLKRLLYIVEDASLKLVITNHNVELARELKNEQRVYIDDIETIRKIESVDISDVQLLERLSQEISDNNLAYVIYTSGSTGKPKGVLVEHRQVARLFDATAFGFHFDCDDVWCLFHSFAFDFSVWEIWGALFHGGQLVVVPKDVARSSQEFYKFCRQSGITVLNQTPSAFNQFIAADQYQGDSANSALPALNLRYIIFGGEALVLSSIVPWVEKYGDSAPEIINMYGITETTVHVTYRKILRSDVMPVSNASVIGRPLADLSAFVLDTSMRPVPFGVAGELFVGGPGITRGYLNRPDLNRERFVTPGDCLTSAGVKLDLLYKTGDLVVFRRNGDLEYLGRIDNQVKIRGFRIELGEIKEVLLQCSLVQHAVVAVAGADADKQLKAFVVPANGNSLAEEQVKEKIRLTLHQYLPEHMIPRSLVLIDEIPLTANGKTDNQALLNLGKNHSSEVFQAPETPTEITLAKVWQELLNHPQVGKMDNFFQLGGHSLMVIRLISRLQKERVRLDAHDIFKYPVLSELARCIDESGLRPQDDVPENRIHSDCEKITPDMLPLVTLSAQELELIAENIPGGYKNIQDIYPLAALQEGLLYHHVIGDGSDPYILPALFKFDNTPALDAFLGTLQRVIDRHDILRTAIIWEGLSQPVQVVCRRVAAPLEYIKVPEAEDGDILSIMEQHCLPQHQWMDLTQAPLLRVKVAGKAVGQTRYALLQLHHLIDDVTSIQVLQQEIAHLLKGEAQALARPVPYRNFVALSARKKDALATEEFFASYLGDVEEPSYPFGLKDVQSQALNIIEAKASISPGLARIIRMQARRAEVSPATIFHCAWAMVISLCCGRDDIVFGTVLSGRMSNIPGADTMLGMFINTLPVRAKTNGESALGFVQGMHRHLQSLIPYEHTSLALAQQMAALPTDTPLFSSLLNYRHVANVPIDKHEPSASDFGISLVHVQERTNYPVSMSVADTGVAFECDVQIANSFDPHAVLGYVFEAVFSIATALAADSPIGISALSVLPEYEMTCMLRLGKAAELALAHDTIIARFDQILTGFADNTAVKWGDVHLSYSELESKANKLANFLTSTAQVKKGDIVALSLPPSTTLVVAVLAVMKAGAAYLPIDVKMPEDRVKYILDDAKVSSILTVSSYSAALQGLVEHTVCLDAEKTKTVIENQPLQKPAAHNDAQSLAYVIYTSGSTGVPKGVGVSHRNFVAFIEAMTVDYPITPGLRVLQFSSFSFDVFVEEFSASVLSGGCLVIPEDEVLTSVEHFIKRVCTDEINVLSLPTAFWHQLCSELQHLRLLENSNLRLIVTGGEAMNLECAEDWRRCVPGEIRVLNSYGPTETTVAVSYYDIAGLTADLPSVPIGRPMTNTSLYVLGTEKNLLPRGVLGELYVAGPQVTGGYFNRSELTEKSFSIVALGHEKKWLYRTGDLVRWQDNGVLSFEGRVDEQVKVRGFRIELKEIEQHLLRHPGVQDALVTYTEVSVGNSQLIAWIVFDKTHADKITEEAVKTWLKNRLPGYMVPATVKALLQFPLTITGKIDRKALPLDLLDSGESLSYSPPTTKSQEILCDLWRDILGQSNVGIHTNFFDLGGHSLLAMRLVSRINERFGSNLRVREVFEHATVASQSELLANQGLDESQSKSNSISQVDRSDPQPLSYAQQRLWFIHQLEPGSFKYNMPIAFKVDGCLDVDIFVKAVDLIVDRHEVLRTVYLPARNHVKKAYALEVEQLVKERVSTLTEVVDLLSEAKESLETQVAEIASHEASMPFDLATDMALRAKVLKCAESSTIILITVHHIAFDGWSIGLLVQELGEIYAALANGKQPHLRRLDIQYADYADWQRRHITANELSQQTEFWCEQLSDIPLHHQLPLDYPRGQIQSTKGAKYQQFLSKEFSTQLELLCRETDSTPFMVLQLVFALFVARYSNQKDVVVGTPVANRNHPQLEPLIGLFVNTLVLRSQFTENLSFLACLAQSKANVLSAMDNQDIPFEMVVKAVNPERSLSVSPIFQLMFSMQQAELQAVSAAGVKFEPMDSEEVVVRQELHLSLDLLDGGLNLTWTYCSELFSRESIERMSVCFKTLLSAILSHPDESIFSLPLLCESEEQKICVEWNNTFEEVKDLPMTVSSVQQVAKEYPDALAIKFGSLQLNYVELLNATENIARALLNENTTPDSVIAIYFERSLELIPAVLAAMKVGAVYLPIEPQNTPERIENILEDAGVYLVLVDPRLQKNLPVTCKRLPIDFADDVTLLSPVEHVQNVRRSLADPAYIIYTSGSTGRPKGVQLTHLGLQDYLQFALRRYYKSGLIGSILLTSHGFDITVPAIYLPLLTGGVVNLVGNDDPLADTLQILQALEQSVDSDGYPKGYLLRMTPQHVQALLVLAGSSIPTFTVRHCFVIGGSRFAPELAIELQNRFPNSQIFNHYGPTEIVVGCTTFDVTQHIHQLGRSIPIGEPADNTALFVLDDHFQPLPIGAVGELYVGGRGVAKGYLNRAELNLSKFIPSPFVFGQKEDHCQQQKLYRTGDLVRWLPAGVLDYVGRADDQVKIRGYRVELGEIENTFRTFPSVRDVAVVARECVQKDTQLVAFIVLVENTSDASGAEFLRRSIAEKLPSYMVPANIELLDALPLNRNGKIDRHKLAAFTLSEVQEIEKPTSPTEQRLVDFWKELLGLDDLGVTTSFFSLGGHSLLAIRLVAFIKDSFSSPVTVADIFTHHTIKSLASLIDARTGADSMTIPCADRGQSIPLSHAQQRLWLIDQMTGPSPQYNVPMALHLTGLLNRKALESSFNQIVQRHEVLRTIYQVSDEGNPVQVINTLSSLPVQWIDLDECATEEKELQLASLFSQEALKPFDLATDIMIRVVVVRLSETAHVLIVNMHHIASDGWSVGVLVDEFVRLYERYTSVKEPSLPELPIQYADYAAWQRQTMTETQLHTQLNYWRSYLNGIPCLHALPTDLPRPKVFSSEAATVNCAISPDVYHGLITLAQKQQVTLVTIVEAALNVLMSRISGSDDVVLGKPIANRGHTQLETLVGFFVNTIAARSQIDDSLPFDQYLGQMQQSAINAFENQEIPFEMVVESLHTVRTQSHSPIFQVMFSVRNRDQVKQQIAGLQVEPIQPQNPAAKFDLILAVAETAHGLETVWEYALDLFLEPTIQRVAMAFNRLLNAIVSRPSAPIADLPLVDTRDVKQLQAWSDSLNRDRLLNETPALRRFESLLSRHEIWVVDRNGYPLPLGAVGELVLLRPEGRLSVSELAKAGVTEECAITEVQAFPAQAIVRTGLFVRVTPDNRVENFGELSQYQWINGYRISFERLRHRILRYPGISDCRLDVRVFASAESSATGAESRYLALYFVFYEEILPTDKKGVFQALHAWLENTLPAYEVPTAMHLVDSIQTLESFDDASLSKPEPEWLATSIDGTLTTEYELSLAKLWGELLEAKDIDARSNFFALGGNSLTLVRLEFAIFEQFKVECSVRALFEASTLAKQARLIAQKQNAVPTNDTLGSSRISPTDRSQPLPLSYAQQRLWFIDRMEGGSPQYNMPIVLRLEGNLDSAALEKSLNSIVARHEVLRTVYTTDHRGQAVQTINPAKYFSIPVEDLSTLADSDKAARAKAFVEENAVKSFDLARDSMLRGCLIRFDECDHLLALTMHHIASDGWSIGVLTEEFAAFYNAYCAGTSDTEAVLPALLLQYGDFAVWEQATLTSEYLDSALAYWREKLTGIPPLHNLPQTSRPFDVLSNRGRTFVQRLPKTLLDDLTALSNAQGVTLFVTLQSLFSILIARLSNETDVVIGTPVANRPKSELTSLIGFFVNTLVLRSTINPHVSLKDFLKENQTSILTAFEFQHLPFEMLVEKLQPARIVNHSPVFQILFSLQNSLTKMPPLPGLKISGYEREDSIVKFDLTVTWAETPEGLTGNWEYRSDLFSESLIRTFANAFETLLSNAVHSAGINIGELTLLSRDTFKNQLDRFTTNTDIPLDKTNLSVLAFFEQHAETQPTLPALVMGDTQVSYATLNARANQVAHALIHQGLVPGQRVGLCAERSPDMIIGLLAVLKAGGAYVPLDPQYPVQRLQFMCEDSDLSAVICQRQLADHPALKPYNIIFVDEPAYASTYPESNPNVPVSAESPAYIIYTSGSTGTPKGALLAHRGLTNLALQLRGQLNVDPQSRVLQFASISFDAATFEWTLALCSGAQLHLISAEAAATPALLDQAVASAQITHALLPPILLPLLDRQAWASVTCLLIGGDTCPQVLADTWSDGRTLYNAYGPSEATVICTLGQYHAGQAELHIGRPLGHCQVYVLDERGHPVPEGVEGELYVGGVGVAMGYVNRPELTAQRFVEPALLDYLDERLRSPLYRTGDRVKWLADGNLAYLGRVDNQVKIDGFHIDVAKITSLLHRHSQVKQSVVSTVAETDGPRLVAYVVANDGADIFEGELEEWLRCTQRLDEVLIPRAFVSLDALPIDENFRIDFSALPDVEFTTESTLPSTDTEIRLAALWEELLGIGAVQRTNNLFELGANSLTTVRLEMAIQESFNVEVNIKHLFEYARLSSQAWYIDQLLPSQERPKLAPLADKPKNIPLSFAQQRLWFIDTLQGGKSPQYNMPIALSISGDLNLVCLQRALDEVIARHEILRTQYHTTTEGTAFQVVREPLPFPLETLDLSGISDDQKNIQMNEIASSAALSPFDLSQDLMLRVVLVKQASTKYSLLVNMHHIASDGWSLGILVQEFSTLYNAFVKEQNSPLQPLPLQYADFALWQREALASNALRPHLEYWKNTLADLPLLHNIRPNFTRPPQQTFNGASLSLPLCQSQIDALAEIAKSQNATLFMALETVFTIFVCRWSGEYDIAVGTPIAGRRQSALSGLIGFFVNNLVLRTRIDDEKSFRALFQENQKTILEAFEHQDVPFELLVDELVVERHINYSPLFQLLFSVQSDALPELKLQGLDIRGMESQSTVAKFDLSVNVQISAESCCVEWTYNTDLFNAWTVERMAVDFIEVLSNIVAAPEIPIRELSFVSPETNALYQQKQFRAISATDTRCLHQQFELMCETYPESIALIFEDQRLSYHAVNRQANKLAHFFIEQGVSEGALIGVYLERSPELIVSILAILKVGAAYLSLDPANPIGRIQYMLEDACSSWVVCQSHLSSAIQYSGKIICLDDPAQRELLAKLPETNPHRKVAVNSAAYVIYTSGSTGKPKGVVVEHQNVISLFKASEQVFNFNEHDCWTLYHSFAFDFSVWEIWGALFYGARLVIVPYQISRNYGDFYKLISEEGVTVLNQTPSAFYLLSDEIVTAASSDHNHYKNLALRYVVFGGEALNPLLLKNWVTCFGDSRPNLINMYGITETTVHVTFRRMMSSDCESSCSVIGLPLNHLSAYICDCEQRLLPPGAAGELYIGGEGVTRGYLNREQLTCERFIESPFGSGERLYRTGDLARWNHAGELEYLGRIDQQAKIRGFRIELGEIEHELLATGLLSQAVVDVVGGDHQRLVAYVSPILEAEPETLVNTLRDSLESILPLYMIPGAFVVEPEIPLTANGKLDRKALKDTAVEQVAAAEYAAPVTAVQRKLCDIWQALLNLERVGVNDNFFSVGGDSIRVVQLVKQAEQRGCYFTVKDVFMHQSVAALSRHLEHSSPTQKSRVDVPYHLLNMEPNSCLNDDVGDRYPITDMQRRMLLAHGSIGLEKGVYQPKMLYQIDGIPFDFDALYNTFHKLLEEHPVLRTRFGRDENGTFWQEILADYQWYLSVLNVNSGVESATQLTTFIQHDFAPFILGQACFRFAVLLQADGSWQLFMSLHHAIIDGWSLVELRNQIVADYPHYLAHKNLPIAPRHNVFKEHVAFSLQASQSQEDITVWSSLLKDFRPMPVCPLLNGSDHSTNTSMQFLINPALAKDLQTFAGKAQVTIKCVLLLAYQYALGELVKTEAVTVDVVTNGRTENLSDPLAGIGLFWQLLPVFVELQEDKYSTLHELSEKLFKMDAYPLVAPGIIADLVSSERLSYAAFNFVNFHNANNPGGEGAAQVRIGYASDRFDYALKLAISGAVDNVDQLAASLDFDREHFSELQMKNFSLRFLEILESIVNVQFSNGASAKRTPVVSESTDMLLT
ncbi:non-ribosomal peptide synthase/polyketide synthase [Teredinibacter turnerae]|uniref:non-ribosomal peptide synthase/polyketide synthase n=1 Tax=Teredinibacter turnerae TaxID=2426 RepID=UPI0030CDD54D